jgi:uncharacterized protein YggE
MMMGANMADTSGAANTEIVAGEQTVSLTVNATFELE